MEWETRWINKLIYMAEKHDVPLMETTGHQPDCPIKFLITPYPLEQLLENRRNGDIDYTPLIFVYEAAREIEDDFGYPRVCAHVIMMASEGGNTWLGDNHYWDIVKAHGFNDYHYYVPLNGLTLHGIELIGQNEQFTGELDLEFGDFELDDTYSPPRPKSIVIQW